MAVIFFSVISNISIEEHGWQLAGQLIIGMAGDKTCNISSVSTLLIDVEIRLLTLIYIPRAVDHMKRIHQKTRLLFKSFRLFIQHFAFQINLNCFHLIIKQIETQTR